MHFLLQSGFVMIMSLLCQSYVMVLYVLWRESNHDITYHVIMT